MKARVIAGLLVLGSITVLCAQSQLIKGKAKDLKRDVENRQTNSTSRATNAPANPK